MTICQRSRCLKICIRGIENRVFNIVDDSIIFREDDDYEKIISFVISADGTVKPVPYMDLTGGIELALEL